MGARLVPEMKKLFRVSSLKMTETDPLPRFKNFTV